MSEVLAQLVSVHGATRYLRSDNGPEFVATSILRWLQTAQIETAFIDPGKPWQNGADESFNGKFRDQHLSLQWFRNRAEAKASIEQWRRHYDEVRPHSSLGYLTPAAFKQKHLADVDGGARRRCRLALTPSPGKWWIGLANSTDDVRSSRPPHRTLSNSDFHAAELVALRNRVAMFGTADAP